jgi:hypothetical protein
MRKIMLPTAIQRELPPAVVEGLVEMFADSQSAAAESFERRLLEETAKLRLDFARMQNELLKWSFLFWLGQVAVVAGMVSMLLAAR